jgi:hypothetical protein
MTMPTAAGLKILLPNPPNISFANSSAQITATAIPYSGIPAGRHKASINAVTRGAPL